MKQTVPVAKGQIYEITIQGLGTSGEGVGRYEGFTVFIPFVLPEEQVKAKITLVKKNYAIGEVVDILKPSPHRVEPICPVYGTCGGCQLQHVSYEEQLHLKTQNVRDIMERIGKTNPALVQPALGPNSPWGYRNKMQIPVGFENDQAALGFYARGSHAIVPCTNCAIQDDGNNKIAAVCERLLRETKLQPYNEMTGDGMIRHIIGRIGKSGWMVIIVSTSKTLLKADYWVSEIRKALPEVTSIVLNHNPKKTNVIMGRDCTLLWGEETITDTIDELEFRLSPHSFFQVNPIQTTVLYKKALEFAQLTGKETVIDAYCGTGTISLFLAKQAKHVIGIEIVEPAIVDAKANAKRNGITNAEFIAADAAKEMPALVKRGVKADVVVFDPIRAGCKEEVLKAAATMEPERMVYVSCNPASMARDIVVLRELGYEVEIVQPVDMFPMTSHCEAVALLRKSFTK
ncbi:23S rRNA (uracil(1939)-C(5))-methyltransferase RlmD [Veillonella criceti]|uniref:23S rRNA (Uracil-C(5))-methyltransferase RlmCD n=1 Tax=Veillonella criceti TaxID=103891 RepID=A0A380NJ21_9FIRM|nr:23S rRNA (uracil(1939)-C(5))-methyltransferase RlmD [Veillonella criceti]SUP41737.1 23S rRNA (uracil-C(5))-methyltransferase RlmCD [Veillonella criceti]